MSFPGGLSDDDYTILKFIADREMVVDPKTVSANTGIDHARVKHRLRKLLEMGFLRRPDRIPEGMSERGLYEVTELGAAYADGDKTIAELRELMAEHERTSDQDNN